MAAATYQVRIDDREVRVQIRREADGVFVRVGDSEETPATLSRVDGVLYTLRLADRTLELMASMRPDDVRLNIGGREYGAEVEDEAHARLAGVTRSHAGAHAHRELKAPMPGLVVKMLAQPGDAIQPGQPLAVLQAMKMENELSLPYGGTVREVRVQSGHTVEQGQVLVVVE